MDIAIYKSNIHVSQHLIIDSRMIISQLLPVNPLLQAHEYVVIPVFVQTPLTHGMESQGTKIYKKNMLNKYDISAVI